MIDLIGLQDILWLMRTNTKVDVGMWFRKRRLYVCLLSHKLVLFANGRKPCAETIPLTELRESRYNHVTGEVVLAPTEGMRINRLKMSPRNGFQLLAQIYKISAN